MTAYDVEARRGTFYYQNPSLPCMGAGTSLSTSLSLNTVGIHINASHRNACKGCRRHHDSQETLSARNGLVVWRKSSASRGNQLQLWQFGIEHPVHPQGLGRNERLRLPAEHNLCKRWRYYRLRICADKPFSYSSRIYRRVNMWRRWVQSVHSV